MLPVIMGFCCSAQDADTELHPFLVDTKFVDWETLTPAYVESDVRLAISLSQSALDAIVSTPDENLTFENTIVALEHACRPVVRVWSRICHLDRVLNSPELRVPYHKRLPEVSLFQSSIYLNDSLWHKVRTFSESPESALLAAIDRRLLKSRIDDFLENGAELAGDDRIRFKNISVELSQKGQNFYENCLDSRNAWERYVEDAAELAGLPASVLERLAAAAQQRNRTGFRLSLDPSLYQPCMDFLDSEALRKELFEGFLTVGRSRNHNNSQNVRDIIALRHEAAKLLGFATHADQVLKRRMAKNGSAALRFVEDLHNRSARYFQKDVQRLRKFAAQRNATLAPWNVAYFLRCLKQTEYDFNPELLRPYFPTDAVLAGLFDLANKLFGITVSPCRTFASEDMPLPVWHPDVRVYDLFDESGPYIGSFYMDLYPRDSKKGGAWMDPIVSGGQAPDGSWTSPLAIIVASLTPATDSRPSLLTLSEVSTIFHEFGHSLHNNLGRVKWPSLNGVNVVWDFVELPSQLMENFCHSRESIDLFARHFETGEKIPTDLWAAFQKSRTALSGVLMMRQLFLAKLDLELHQNYNTYADGDIDAKLEEILRPYAIDYGFTIPTDTLRFEHIFGGGYNAAYYSYKWAEVLDADAFTRFVEGGVVSPEIGNRFRETVLAKGDSEDAAQLYKDFMGRDPDLTALLVRSGFKNAPKGQGKE
jgi:oligopeptidase A